MSKITCVNIEVTQPSATLGVAIVGPDTTWNTEITGLSYRKSNV